MNYEKDGFANRKRSRDNAFKFNEPGKFIEMAEKDRLKKKMEMLHQKVQMAAKKTGIASAAKLAIYTTKNNSYDVNSQPIEWWDAAILPFESYEAFFEHIAKNNISFDENNTLDQIDNNLFVGLSNLIEHPVEKQPPNDPVEDKPLPVYLTKREQKKLRKQQRKLKTIEKHEKIRLGLEAPPPPKVKIANLMRVLGTEAVADPTKVEAHVREQMQARLKAHEENNLARKLTDEERRAKKIKKLKEDTGQTGVHSCVFRIFDLSNPSKKFKVDKNAVQNFLTGVAILYEDMNLVIVEGGPKGIKRYKKLMTDRINWGEDVIGSCATNADRKKVVLDAGVQFNKCVLVWEGVNKVHFFSDWSVKTIESDAVARELLKRHSCEHYYDLAYILSLDDAK